MFSKVLHSSQGIFPVCKAFPQHQEIFTGLGCRIVHDLPGFFFRQHLRDKNCDGQHDNHHFLHWFPCGLPIGHGCNQHTNAGILEETTKPEVRYTTTQVWKFKALQ